MNLLRLAAGFLFLGVLAMIEARPVEFRAMTWNIWRGGRMDGLLAGPRRVVEVIRSSRADLVAMQETYGSGELISRELMFNFKPRGTNVSIHSRYPIVEDISVFQEFKCVGALVQLPNGSRVAFYSIWLPYSGEIWEPGTRNSNDLASLLAACAASAPDLEKIRDDIAKRLADPKYADVPIIIAGDFNSMSHLDYTAVTRDEHKAEVAWPTSQVMTNAGFRDAYREHNLVVDRQRDRTWTPRFHDQEQDRIDFIYYQGRGLRSKASHMHDQHPILFPSDHAAVTADFVLDPAAKPPSEVTTRVVSYNIKHGRGNDNRLDLDRSVAVLKRLRPDIIGLQEVDLGVGRSERMNQPRDLGRKLGMHAAFGAFMDYDGGRYGMAILSRYPLVNVRALPLPKGNEPRVALVAEVRLPSGEVLTVVNVHFDWVDDDAFRFAQASELAAFLRQLKTPYVLLGDFNDGPTSRTLRLFRELATEAAKPRTDRFTFSSIKPESEIDFIFYAPANRWSAKGTRVITEPMASDHRPVVSDLRLAGP